jgi:ABC-type Fe3+-hydroxamate transport system substrate-binding protein
MKRALALFALAALSLAACGDGSSDGDDAAGAGEATGAVTVDHAYGTTTIDGTPERVVSVNTQWTDVLVALDAPLVGAALDPTVDTGRYPWQDVIPSTVEPITVTDAIPYEDIAALRPDLIVVSWAAETESDYDRLSEIAPTIPLLAEDLQVDPWQDMATVAGEILGKADEAAALVADVDGLSDSILAEMPGLEGRTYALANYVPGDKIYVVADPEDGSSLVFSQLGLQIDPDLLALADGASGRMELSLERVDELDADLLFLLTNGADPAEIPGYDQLPAVQDGAVVVLDMATAVGLNTPTPLSLPYSLDQVRPALEAAAT